MRRIAIPLLVLVATVLGVQQASAAPTCTITAAANGAWGAAATWGGSTPGAADHVCVPAGRTVTLSGAASVQTLQLAGTLTVTGGTLTVASTAEESTLSGTLAGDGDMTLSGLLTWSNGTMTGTGTTTVLADAKVANTGYTTLADGRVLDNFGTVELPTDNRYVSRTGAAPLVRNRAGATIRRTASGSVGIELRVPVENDGAIVSDSGALELTNGGTGSSGSYGGGAGTVQLGGGVHELGAGATLLGGAVLSAGELAVADGATVVASGHTTITGGTVSGPGRLSVDGTLTWSNGTMKGPGTTAIAPAGTLINTGYTTLSDGRVVENSGVIELPTDNRYVSRSGAAPVIRNLATGVIRRTATGPVGVDLRVPVENDGAIVSDGGLLQLTGGGSGSGGEYGGGAGTVRLGGGVHELVAGASLLDRFELAAGELVVADGATVVASGATAISGGTIGGPGALSVEGTLTWSNGTMRGPGTTAIAPSAKLLNTGYTTLSDGRVLDNFGTVELPTDNRYVSRSGAAPLVRNRAGATIRRTASGTVGVDLRVPVESQGAIVSDGGLLSLTGGGSGGTNAVFGGGAGTTRLQSGTWQLADGVRLQSGIAIANTTVTIAEAATVTVTGGTLAGGTIGGAGTLAITGPGTTFSWTDGTMSGSGVTSVAAGATLSLPADGGLELAGTRTLSVAGLLDASGDNSLYGTSGLLHIQSTGTLRKSGGDSWTFVDVPLRNDGAVQGLAGELRLSQGATPPHTGSFQSASATAFVTLTGEGHVLTGAARLEDFTRIGGDVAVRDGDTLELAADVIQTAGELSGDVRVTGTLTWSGGSHEAPGATTVEPGGEIVIDRLGASGCATTSLGEARRLVNHGILRVIDGSHLGTFGDLRPEIHNSGRLELDSAGSGCGAFTGIAGDALVANTGEIVKLGGAGSSYIGSSLDNDGTILNSAPGELRLESNAAIGHSGTFRSTGGAVAFDSGTFVLETGAAVEGDAAVDGADLQLPEGMTLAVAAGDSLRLSSGSITGAGALRVSGELEWSGGGQEGPGTTVIEAGGSATIAPAQDDETAFVRLEQDRSLVNRGATVMRDGYVGLDGGASILNRGTLELSGGTRLSGSGYGYGYGSLLHNAGIVRTGDASAVEADVPVDNDGVLEVGTGTFELAELLNWTGNGFFGESGIVGGEYVVKGTLVVPGPMNANGARLTLDGAASRIVTRSFTGGQVDALAGLHRNAGGGELVLGGGRSLDLSRAFLNHGILDLGAGSTLRAGGFRQAPGGVLRPDVAAGGIGRVVSIGPAELGGRLDTPATASVPGDASVLSAPSVTGAFDSVTGAYQALQTATGVTLRPPGAPVGLGAAETPAGAGAGEPVVRLIDGAALALDGPWTRRGAYLVARRRGATLTARGVRGSGVSLVARTCRRCGAVRVTWAGRTRVVRLGSKRARHRTIHVFRSAGTPHGTVRVRTTSARRVAIDALLVSR